MALLEIVFNARTEEGMPYYKLPDDGDDSLLVALCGVLEIGKAQGDFKVSPVNVMAKVIQRSIGEYMSTGKSLAIDAQQYSEEVIEIIRTAMKVEGTKHA